MSDPLLYRAYTQAELDRAYDQRAWASNADEVLARHASAGVLARAELTCIEAAYGPSAAETLAIFPAASAGAPVHVHVHGGSWRALSKDDQFFLAPGFVAAGITLIVLGFAKIPAVRIPEMVAQTRRAIAWVARNIERYGGDPQRIHLSGHSSGAHLASVLLTTDWTAHGLDVDVIKSGVLISGMYDLEPVLLSARRAFVTLEANEVAALSAIRCAERIGAPLALAYGALESPEFKRQAIEFAAALRAARKPVSLSEIAGRNHFEILADLADPRTAIGATAFAFAHEHGAGAAHGAGRPVLPQRQEDRGAGRTARAMTSPTASVALAPPVTRDLAAAIAAFDLGAVPEALLHEAKRSLFNVLAVAIGASMHPGVDAILRVARETGGTPVAPVVGRRVLANAHFAALANGFAAHVDDYDDTHLATVIHPAAAIAATLLALAPATQPAGAAALRAFVLGCEIQLRLGVAISPEHYDDGWHITGTCGTIGAAVAAAALLGLDADATARAIGIAACSTVGQREAFGRMTKAYHAGKAAASGIRAAALAKRGFGAPENALEAPGGFADALATTHRIGALDLDLRANFELAKNTYKPYPCGIVAHPSIDAAVALAPRIGTPANVDAVVVHCNPLVPELMGNLTPGDGLQARFSAVHGVTMGLRDGTVGLAQYEDVVVIAEDVAALRARVTLEPDRAVPRASARLTVRLKDGTTLEETVVNARGSLERPLTDAELGAKALALVEPVLPGRLGELRRAISDLPQAAALDDLIAAVTP